MGASSFNIGRDGSQITIFDSVAGQVTFGGMTSFDSRARTKELESEQITGNTIFRNVPNGHEGTFEFDRQDSSIEAYFAQLEANFYAGLPPPVAVITQTIQELSGGLTQFQYTGVQLKLDDAGAWKGLDKVNPKVGWKASKKIPLSVGF
ncbi:hypothetical protein SAMN05443245_5249 [Paraburkholderia fungorum]|uniref:Uncharacterized protein n=1 Tax=Paraburkholderia fungorum TaxID=134537 RepID=A0A1H1IJU5_9BURK|nr:hypothetical protein [Paraburkholderia fungorum]SDR37648.1 hypothetical protein SAMN05443245_5249 [Paraburkholderia fungorum]